MKKSLKTIGTLLLIMVIAAGYAGYLLFTSPFGVSETSYVYIDTDDTMDSVRTKVETAGQASSMSGFSLMSTLKRFNKPRTGRYSITPGESMFSFVRNMANGHQTPVNLVVPVTRTVEDMAERLSSTLMISKDDLMALFDDSDFIGKIGYTKQTLPCLFIPNTYEVYWNISAEQLVNRLNKEKEAFWNAERKAKAGQIGFTPVEVATIASIVESETSYGPEKATIAGLYIHRLQIDMPLQSDPTVIFAIGDFSIRRVSHAQTQYESPYNTYVNQGLPPGPIRVPSIAGIDAVLNYDHNTYLYMCAKEDFSGSHNFTSSYSEHLQNARRYQQALNQRGIRR